MDFRSDEIALFSSRETCACEMPTSEATSVCVLQSKKRIPRMRRSLMPSLPIASRRASR